MYFNSTDSRWGLSNYWQKLFIIFCLLSLDMYIYFYFYFSILISLIHAFSLFYSQIYRSISICITYFKEYAFLLMFLCFNVWTEVPPRIGTEKGLGPLDCVPIWYAHWAEQRGNFFKTKLKKITFRIYSTYWKQCHRKKNNKNADTNIDLIIVCWGLG